jgi:hypothetical protein
MTMVLLLALTQSLLQDDASPYDPPKKPSLKKHDHVTIEFAAPAKAAADAKPKWDRELRQWIRSDAKDTPATAVTAEVVDVRPNGTMVLLAVKRRTVHGVQEALRLTGEVAPSNVAGGKVSADHVLNLSVAIDADK